MMPYTNCILNKMLSALLQYYCIQVVCWTRCSTSDELQLHNTNTQWINQEQEQMDWKQLYYGLLTTAWAYSSTTGQNTIKGIVFIPGYFYLSGKLSLHNGSYKINIYIRQMQGKKIAPNWNEWFGRSKPSRPVTSMDPILNSTDLSNTYDTGSPTAGTICKPKKAASLHVHLCTHDIWTYSPNSMSPKPMRKSSATTFKAFIFSTMWVLEFYV